MENSKSINRIVETQLHGQDEGLYIQDSYEAKPEGIVSKSGSMGVHGI
jgi:hypothetical protein